MLKVTLHGGKLAYDRIGSGIPMVLLHGFPLDHRIWTPMLPFLQDTFDVIMPDLRGFGSSFVPDAPFTIADLADDISELMDILRIEKAIIAGHSMGGYTALAFANNYPEKLSGFGLISTQAQADSEERRKGRYDTIDAVTRNGVELFADTMSVKFTPDEKIRKIIVTMIKDQPSLSIVHALEAMAQRPDSTSTLSTVQVPTVIVHGDADELISLERSKELNSSIGQSSLKILRDVGHLPMMEDPEETAGEFVRMFTSR